MIYEQVMIVNDWDDEEGCYVIKAFDKQGNRLNWGDIQPLYRRIEE